MMQPASQVQSLDGKLMCRTLTGVGISVTNCARRFREAYDKSIIDLSEQPPDTTLD
jgi:hypothetical protein